MESKLEITINSFEHFIYCKRRWGLIVIESEWSENYKTIQGGFVHKLVDDPFFNEKRNEIKIVRSLPIFYDELSIHGTADCVEFIKNDNGYFIKELGYKCSINVIEYKNGEPKTKGVVDYNDSMQVVTQMMCINDMFSAKCEGYVYYNTIARRIKVTDFETKSKEILSIISEMSHLYNNKEIPPRPLKQNCHNCSMYDICIPKVNHESTHEQIINSWSKAYEKIT